MADDRTKKLFAQLVAKAEREQQRRTVQRAADNAMRDRSVRAATQWPAQAILAARRTDALNDDIEGSHHFLRLETSVPSSVGMLGRLAVEVEPPEREARLYTGLTTLTVSCGEDGDVRARITRGSPEALDSINCSIDDLSADWWDDWLRRLLDAELAQKG